MISEGIGFGKAILFNEHFVVYGIPSIVSAIGNYTIAKISPSDTTGFKISDDRGATPGYKEGKIDQQKVSFENSLAIKYPDIAKEWNYKKNKEINNHAQRTWYCLSPLKGGGSLPPEKASWSCPLVSLKI